MDKKIDVRKVKVQGQNSQYCPILSNFIAKICFIPSNPHLNKFDCIQLLHITKL